MICHQLEGISKETRRELEQICYVWSVKLIEYITYIYHNLSFYSLSGSKELSSQKIIDFWKVTFPLVFIKIIIIVSLKYQKKDLSLRLLNQIKKQIIWKITAGWALWTRAKAHSRERTLEARMSLLQKEMRLRQNRWTAAHSNVAIPARITTPEVKLWSWEYFLSHKHNNCIWVISLYTTFWVICIITAFSLIFINEVRYCGKNS